ncbi:hypothetical protein BDQ17DRAFT_651557 [Cyathus striatus]|nr:hypothetical protein BDQ17DRAFT_651557 [Cyathus striatus]
MLLIWVTTTCGLVRVGLPLLGYSLWSVGLPIWIAQLNDDVQDTFVCSNGCSSQMSFRRSTTLCYMFTHIQVDNRIFRNGFISRIQRPFAGHGADAV